MPNDPWLTGVIPVTRSDAVALTSATTPSLDAPAGASSAGPVSLTTADTEVVGAIPVAGTYPGLTLTYTLSANVSAGVVATTPYSVVLSVVP